MGEKRMYACMCNWVTMLYSGKKKLYWGNNNKKNAMPFISDSIKFKKTIFIAPDVY